MVLFILWLLGYRVYRPTLIVQSISIHIVASKHPESPNPNHLVAYPNIMRDVLTILLKEAYYMSVFLDLELVPLCKIVEHILFQSVSTMQGPHAPRLHESRLH